MDECRRVVGVKSKGVFILQEYLGSSNITVSASFQLTPIRDDSC